MKIFCITRAKHAVLHQRYDLNANKYINVGNSQGMYAPEDKATGAEYRALSLGDKGNKCLYSTDLRVGYFYSPNTFIWGEDEKRNSLSHQDVEEFCKRLGYGNKCLQRAMLPRGYNKGQMTWDHAIYFTPVEMQPSWDFLLDLIKGRIGKNSIFDQRNYYLEVEVD